MSPFNIKNAALCLLSLPFLPMRYVDAYDANHGEDRRLFDIFGTINNIQNNIQQMITPCGNGNRGNGVCADGTCCSKYGWCGTSTDHCSGRMLRGNNGNSNTTETEAKLELQLETETEVFDDLIDEPSASENDEPLIKEKDGSIDIDDVALELEMAVVDIDIDEPFITDMDMED